MDLRATIAAALELPGWRALLAGCTPDTPLHALPVLRKSALPAMQAAAPPFAGLAGPGQVRVNKSGCLDRCAAGPVAVVYPEAVWYTFIDDSDIDEIVESHLKNGKVVERLVLPEHVGR